MMNESLPIPDVRRLKWMLLICSLVTLVVLLLAMFDENLAGSWRQHQEAYRAALLARADTAEARQAAGRMDIQFQQLYLPELKRVDRCVTCHIAVTDPAQAGAEQPLAAHSGELLAHHPPDKFGCTVCHDGQPRAIEQDAAHGEVPHWPTPLLRGEAVYTSCGKCHYENDLYGITDDLFSGNPERTPLDEGQLSASVPGAGSVAERAIGRGKRLVLDSGCLGCHTFRGRGGTLGPDITYVGDKTVHDFDFANIHGEHTLRQWLFEHFKQPGQVVPGTLMPDLELSDAQAEDLAQYMLSLHRKQMGAAHTPVPSRRQHRPAGGARLFAMFCSSCHGEQGYGSMVLDPELMVLADPPAELMTPAINNADTLAAASDDFLRHIMTTGRRDTNMLGWSAAGGGLSTAEIERLVEYVRSWESAGPALTSISAARGDRRRGRALYRSRCTGCHGSKGEGGIGVALNSLSFLAAASDQFLAQAIVFGRANTAMPSWKQLDAGEVSDLLAHIRSWEQQPPAKGETLAKLAANGAPDSRSLRIGKVLYSAHCATCHGSNGAGGIGPSLNTDAFLAVVNDGYLFDAIVSGRPGTAMPSWKHFAPDDMVDLINYLRSWNGRERRELAPYLARGDWDRGKGLFQGTCAPCHGVDAEGATGPQLNNPVFLASASDAMLRQWVRFGKVDTPMRAFAKGSQGMVEMSDAQIDDVVTYLRRLERDRPTVTSRPGMGIAARGAVLYAGACAQCHGADGEGVTGSALANPDFLAAASDGYLQATIALGRDGTEMRAMGKGGQGNVELSPEDIDNLVAFLRRWEHHPPPAVKGGRPVRRYVISADLADGRTLYEGHCSGCHGAAGNDGVAPALNNADFLAAATDGFLQATIARGRADTPMRPFGRGANGMAELSTDQINNIVGFIRTWAPPPYAAPAERGSDAQLPQVASETSTHQQQTPGSDPG